MKIRGVSGEPNKGVQEAVHPTAVTRRMAVKGEDVKAGCRGLSRTRMSDRQRSASWDFDNKPVAVRARGALRDAENHSQLKSSSQRSTPRASSVNLKRPGSTATTEKSILARVASPVLRASHLAPSTKRSAALHIYRDEALSKSGLSTGRTSIKPGLSKVASTNSPPQAGVNRRRLVENKPVVKASPLSITSGKCAKSSSVFRTTSKKYTNPVRSASKVVEQEEEVEGFGSIQSSLHGRLSMLEGRVNQIAAELRETKELLGASNPISSKGLLTDIHSKIMNIERCMTGSPIQSTVTRLSGRISSGRNDSDGLRERILMEQEGFKKALQSLTNKHRYDVTASEPVPQRLSSEPFSEDSPALEAGLKPLHERQTLGSQLSNATSPKVSGVHERPALNHSRLEIVCHGHIQPTFEVCYSKYPSQALKPVKTGSFLHHRLAESRATLNENDNRELLCMRLAEFGGRDKDEVCACDEGEVMSTTFPTSLDENSSSGGSVLSYKKHRYSGWFACKGEGILLAHDDSSCSYHDVANMEEKVVYSCPSTLTSRRWGDCWIVQAPGTDGRSSKFVVAASGGGTRDSAFCSWDFYSRKTVSYHCELSSLPNPPRDSKGRARSFDQETPFLKDSCGPESKMALRKWLDRSGAMNMTKLSGNAATKKAFNRCMSLERNDVEEVESKPVDLPLWWYRPCGPLLASVASGLSAVSLYDIRDGESVMRWETQKVVASMAYSSPVQWRNKSKLVLTGLDCLSFWDVESLKPQLLHTVNLPEKQMRALHVYNVDAECSGGVRQRLSASEHHSDGILCTDDAVNVLDFRVPTGIGKKFPTLDEDTQSIFADGDAVYSGAISYKARILDDGATTVMQPQSILNHWSIRQGKLMNVYSLPLSNCHTAQLPITQVWGSSDTIMAANGNGLFVMEPARQYSSGQVISNVRCILGPDELDNPTFDFASSCVLLISRQRPAQWGHWP
ncbi:KIN14B-interacting protein At4g14310 isoform X2 [Physcomitrium patens]|uniref:At4g14310 8-bladed propeller domain-containing protein n=1 Tax=Physcomitrium patens TaxID=3218 RepID=A0A2K1IE55_PHYPA|nr:KIN14B-interacting protein At4g14310-like isoform X2 [Physcomitrium patens]PNR27558.1 hypothetical protein PHYPA_029710 [Physcomitrium patens]|eukprot:XP_024365738.1 KIN14B-interacting protein At4g14310-like isoform X2 [Physcomitrella patens]